MRRVRTASAPCSHATAGDDAGQLEAAGEVAAKGLNGIVVPVWGYYALGLATALLPRIIAGGGM